MLGVNTAFAVLLYAAAFVFGALGMYILYAVFCGDEDED